MTRRRARIAPLDGIAPLAGIVTAGFALLFALIARPAFAQHDHSQMTMAKPGWTWTFDASGSLNLNVQKRKAADTHEVESQNWLMVMGGRAFGVDRSTRVMFHSMLSFEPFTLREIGSAEAFQTGETFKGHPLIDYQHPHDLFMGLGATITHALGKSRSVFATGAIVGEPTLGPTAFMHRESSEGNPTAPLSHHTLDSTHITHGVIAGGYTAGEITVEASTFHGREPDEHRLDIEMGALDSYAARVWWRRGPWAAQVSGGHLKQPDAIEASDLNRYTASVEYRGFADWRPLSFTVALGLNHHPNLNGHSVKEGAALVDVAWRVRPKDLLYLRGELVDKSILEAAEFDPAVVAHAAALSRVGALTAGYQRRLWSTGHGSLGLGGDVTIYRTPPNLLATYGHPVSMHVLLVFKSMY